jgi:hypothetical protein
MLERKSPGVTWRYRTVDNVRDFGVTKYSGLAAMKNLYNICKIRSRMNITQEELQRCAKKFGKMLEKDITVFYEYDSFLGNSYESKTYNKMWNMGMY